MSKLPENRKPLSWQDIPFSERLEIEKLQERVAELEAALRVIESHRRKCHEYDADVGDELRDFDEDDVRLMEWQARAALAEKNPGS